MTAKKINKSDFVRARRHSAVTPGESLCMLRELQGYTQKRLAELTGITQSNISSLENDITQLGRERAIVLARALRVHPAILLFPDFDISSIAA